MARPNVGYVHGTLTCYQKGCRCDLCGDRRRAYMREYHARRKAASIQWRGKVVLTGRHLHIDVVVARVGDDFPALGTTLRALAVMGA